MVSRRNYMTIMIMMGVIFFLFLFIGVGKEQLNEFQKNAQYKARTTRLDRNQMWKASPKDWDKSETLERILFVGDENSGKLENMVSQWCGYTKRNLWKVSNITAIGDTTQTPGVVVLDSALIKDNRDILTLQRLAEQGVHLVFCGLPEVQLIQGNQTLRDLTGIYEMKKPEVQLTGIHLFEGFLLGGESIYKAETQKEEKKQDLQLTVPWCVLGYGTKVYMLGMLKDERIKNEELPAIIWRASYGDAKVFVVNGDYMEDLTGIGFLSAMMTEIASYDIYPVINAQNLTLVGYPVLASENNDKMEQLYARDQKSVLRDVVGPGITTISEISSFKMSSMLIGKMNFVDGNLPKKDSLVYYLKQMNARQGEMGVAFSRKDDTSLSEAAKQLNDFLQKTGFTYDYVSMYLGREDAENAQEMAQQLKMIQKYPSYQNTYTVVSEYSEKDPLLSYLNEKVTLQSGMFDGYSHTYSENLKLKGLETALGYSNVILKLERALWPKEEADQWEKLYDEFASNINTYWRPFRMYESTTLIESDQRIRRFLALNYTASRQEDAISLEIENFEEKAWFLLRTQGETISKIEGAEYVRMEKDVFLIEAGRRYVEIHLEPELEVYYHE